MVQDLCGPRLVPVQASAVMPNAAEPAVVIFSAALAEPPELVRVNTWNTLCPALGVA
jgi:hypothetical protein